jgi:hypothetical protein
MALACCDQHSFDYAIHSPRRLEYRRLVGLVSGVRSGGIPTMLLLSSLRQGEGDVTIYLCFWSTSLPLKNKTLLDRNGVCFFIHCSDHCSLGTCVGQHTPPHPHPDPLLPLGLKVNLSIHPESLPHLICSRFCHPLPLVPLIRSM